MATESDAGREKEIETESMRDGEFLKWKYPSVPSFSAKIDFLWTRTSSCFMVCCHEPLCKRIHFSSDTVRWQWSFSLSLLFICLSVLDLFGDFLVSLLLRCNLFRQFCSLLIWYNETRRRFSCLVKHVCFYSRCLQKVKNKKNIDNKKHWCKLKRIWSKWI